MGSHKTVRKLIHGAIDACSGGELAEVRKNLEEALRSLKKNEKRKENKRRPDPKPWQFDFKTGSLKRPDIRFVTNALDRIQKAIKEEEKKLSPLDESDLIRD